MNIFNRIKSVKDHIINLKNQIPYIKNQQKLDKHIAMVNDIILLINDVEFMIDSKISSNVIDKLILSNMHLIIQRNGVKNGIDMKAVISEINDTIKEPLAMQMYYLTDVFTDIETTRSLDKIEMHQDSNGLHRIDKSVSDEEINEVANELKHQTTPEAFEIILKDLIKQFKIQATWN